MKSKILKNCLPVLLLAAAVGCTNGTKTDNRQPIPAATHDTVYPQFPGGNEALDKHLKEIKDIIILEIDEKGKTNYVNYGSRLITNDENTIKIINALPNWTPGTLDGKPARFCYVYSNNEKAPMNKCINAGRQSERHKLAKLWTLCDTDSEGLNAHPIYKTNKGKEIYISFNYNYDLLQTIGNNESEYLYSVVSDTTNKFAIQHNEKTAITYSYKVNKDGDVLTTHYTDANGQRQTLQWINVAFFERNDLLNLERKVVPPPPSAKHITEIIEIAPDDAAIDESEIMMVENQGEIVEITEISSPDNESTDGETIHQVVEQQPEFPGGMQALMKHLKDNIKYPQTSRDNNSQGKTYVNFVVNTDGSIQDVKILRSSGDVYLDREAIRVVTDMPAWNLGKHKGKAVRVRFTLPVTFRLQ
ncbi:MAG: energy transducer TonB [Bacteroidaceae bacterium]|nr:energy transducer TonB [Bacteroidaceae bacterium]